ncbi:protein NO VEIN domain-containing protein [Streptomyces griseocarneus]|uniref:protein NO VEIN domain-containing protein n=1 Tax=Streptomyces griseocarneus TaxID=51201 RepID=UPI00167F199E|nr:DUF3883 domain-containing protein [Streptomyces griseocarneus]MBZ6477832.1 DUF3883 domain-containing protein [Streptomyces griseocarneus]GHG58133.1 hypothetical protein GCM10018779_23440 [Streptomyces griseocarneus]
MFGRFLGTLMASLPGDGVLRAAVRWLVHLRAEEVSRLRALFTHHRRYSDLTPAHYADALVWLRQVGLLRGDDRLATLPSDGWADDDRGLLASLLEAALPEWLVLGDWPLSGPEGLPKEARRMAGVLNMSDHDVGAALLAVRCKVDTSLRERVGEAGEQALLLLLRQALEAEVRHVAAESDSYGYDIEVSGERQRPVHIEVKTTTDPSRLVVYLSRHEYETLSRDDGWAMVAVLLGPYGEVAATATVDPEWLAQACPHDSHHSARWESVRLFVPHEALSAGIASVRTWVKRPWAAEVLMPEGWGACRPWGVGVPVNRPPDEMCVR